MLWPAREREKPGCPVSPAAGRRGRVRLWLLPVLLVLGTAIALIVLQPWSHVQPPRVLLVGIDGADWRPIRALLAEGQLPNLTRLIQQGAHGPLWGVPPLIPPVGWTTIATGKGPDQHGVLGFTMPDPRTGQPIAVASGMRRSKAFWNILADHGLRVGLVGWWATGPAEPIPGVVVSDRVLRHALIAETPTTEGAVYPPERAAEFLARRDRVKAPSYKIARQFMDVTADEYRAARDEDPNDPVAAFRHLYQGMRATADIAVRIQRRDRPDVLAVYFEGVDTANHFFGPFAPSGETPASGDKPHKFSRTLPEIYRLQDELLGRLLELTDDATTVVVVSAYGFRPELQPPVVEGETSDHIVVARAHRAEGILVMKGPRIRHRTSEKDPAAISDRATAFDITPTLLALLDLPVGQDMEGKPLTDLLVENFPEPSRISSYEDEAWARDRAAARPDYSGLDEPTRERLRSLGYLGIDDPSGIFALRDYETLAEYFGVRGNVQRAEQLLQALVDRAPDEPRPYFRLGLANIAQKKFATARTLLEKALALDPKFVEARMNLAYAFRELGEPLKAIALLEEGARLHPGHAGLRVNLGMLHQEINDMPGAARLFEEALRINPDHQPAHVQLAMILEQQGHLEEALVHWQEALRLRPNDRMARDHVTLVERRLGRTPASGGRGAAGSSEG
jgi:predicted AlkP superfamily phosphohydrolase/phosphomutase/Flp pilus assembly protein TadD